MDGDGRATRPRRSGTWMLGLLVIGAVAVGYVTLGDGDEGAGSGRVTGEVAVPSPPPAAASPTTSSHASSARSGQVAVLPALPLPDGWRQHRAERFSIQLPDDWHFTSESFTSEIVAPRDIFALATFDLDDLPPADEPRSWCLPELVAGVGPEDVLVVFFAPTYLAAAPEFPPPFGDIAVDDRELQDARDAHEDSPGFCGNPDAMFLAESGGIGEWVYDVWIVLGERSAPEHLQPAARAINSFRIPGADG